jgi:endoglucanase
MFHVLPGLAIAGCLVPAAAAAAASGSSGQMRASTASWWRTPGPSGTPGPSVTSTVASGPTATPAPSPIATSKQFGVSIAGAEFGDARLPGTVNVDYVYGADRSRQAYFAGKGLKLVRFPFRWERVQPAAKGPLSAADVAGIRSMLDTAQAAGQQVILDLHNYGRYYGAALQRADAPLLADVWTKLAGAFQGHPALYGYELMNEPHDQPEGADAWAYLAQSTTNAIRKVDQRSWVLVPGYGWQTAQFWAANNATLEVHDSAGKLLYAAHQYFDGDCTGTYRNGYDADRAYPAIGVDRIQAFLGWLSLRNARGVMTEYGVPGDDVRWLNVLDAFLAQLDRERRLVGGTYWAAGPWWGTAYPLSVEPADGQDRPQMAVLSKYPSR